MSLFKNITFHLFINNLNKVRGLFNKSVNSRKMVLLS